MAHDVWESGADESSRDERSCVDCVSEALAQRAEAVSEEELQRAGRRLKELSSERHSVIGEMVKRLAMRIVDSPIRQLRESALRDHARTAAKVRWIFGLEEPDPCPLASLVKSDEKPALDDPALACPHRSRPEDA